MKNIPIEKMTKRRLKAELYHVLNLCAFLEMMREKKKGNKNENSMENRK